MSRPTRVFSRLVVAAVVAALTIGLSAAAAGAHVTIDPDAATKGGFQVLSFSVPNERDETSTVKLEIQLPQNVVIPFVSVQPKPGWTVTVTKRALDEPVEGEDGEISEVVDTVAWEGGQIGPGEFDLFLISVGPLPKKGKQLRFPAIQTYSDGEEVRWIETGRNPELPAPVLKLASASSGEEEDSH
jgi:uncharacterized protein